MSALKTNTNDKEEKERQAAEAADASVQTSDIILLSDFIKRFKPEEGKLRKALSNMYLVCHSGDARYVSSFMETFLSAADTLICHEGAKILGALYLIPAHGSIPQSYQSVFAPRSRLYYGCGLSISCGCEDSELCMRLHRAASDVCRQRGAGYFTFPCSRSSLKTLGENGLGIHMMLSKREYATGDVKQPVKFISPSDYNRERNNFFTKDAVMWQDRYLAFSENFARYKICSVHGVCFFAEKKKDVLIVHEMLCRGSLADELVPGICAFFGASSAQVFFPSTENGEKVVAACANELVKESYVNILYN